MVPKKTLLAVAATICVASASARAEIVTVTFALNVEKREINSFPVGTPDPTFVPFNSTMTLSFDSTWVDGQTDSSTPGITTRVATFAGPNQFTSGLTALLPWGPPFPPSADVEYDRSLFIHDTFEEPGDGPSARNGLFFDKRHHYDDLGASLEYRHAFALQDYEGTVYPIAAGFEDFRTDDLMAYLFLLKAGQIPFGFHEYSLIYDFAAHQYTEVEIYRSHATITSISASSIVPVPGAAWMLGGALGALGGLRRSLQGCT